MTGAFGAVLEAVEAAQSADVRALRAALLAAPPERFFGKAVGHRCAGIIFAAMAQYRMRDAAMLDLWRMLQGYAAHCALANERARAQADGITEALGSAGVPHALLKGAARLRAGEPGAQWSQMDDIDLLVPRTAADAAARALQNRGYRFECDPRAQEGYKAVHHHLAPLIPDDGGKPVEVHVNLGYLPWFSTATDWSALGEHLKRSAGAAPSTYTLDAFGRALHALIHAVGLYRLGDVAVLAAELRRAPSLLTPLANWIFNERKQHVALHAVLTLGARVAQVPYRCERSVERYLEWVMWREGAPGVFRNRLQFLDAYFSNAIALALPERYACDGAKVPAVERVRTVGVRLGAALAAAGYRGLHPR